MSGARSRFRGVMAALLLLAGSTIVSLAALEGALRLITPQWAIPYPPYCYRPGLFERWDPYGYRVHPARAIPDVYPFPDGRRLIVNANRDGFRGTRELGEADPRPRIVVLGDSLVWGTGVDETERLTERLEGLRPDWRVDNLGMVGFGPDLMLRALESVALTTRPAVVVLVMFSHDVYRVVPEAVGVGFPLPRYELRDGALVDVPYPIRPPWMRLYVVQGLRYAWFRYTGAVFPLNDAILARFVALARQHRFVPVVAFVAGPRERFDDGMRRRWLAGWTSAHDVPFLDLTEPLAMRGLDRVYLPNDSHWTPEGHAVVAETFAGFLATRSETAAALK